MAWSGVIGAAASRAMRLFHRARDSAAGDHPGGEGLAVEVSPADGYPELMTSLAPPLESYHEQGFVILRDVLAAPEIEALRAGLQPYLIGRLGKNCSRWAMIIGKFIR